MQYYGGLSEAVAKNPGTNQSAGGSQVFEYLVQPQEFTMLKTGGPECEMKVDGVIFQGGRRWVVQGRDKAKTQNFIRHTFAQIHEGQAG